MTIAPRTYVPTGCTYDHREAIMATPIRNVRVPNDVWHAAAARAERDTTTVSAVIVAALREYGRAAA